MHIGINEIVYKIEVEEYIQVSMYNVYMYVSMYVCMHVCTYVGMCMYMYMYIYMCV